MGVSTVKWTHFDPYRVLCSSAFALANSCKISLKQCERQGTFLIRDPCELAFDLHSCWRWRYPKFAEGFIWAVIVVVSLEIRYPMAEGFIWTILLAALFAVIVARVTFVMPSNACAGQCLDFVRNVWRPS
jgi:hypothetical protein